MRVCKSECKRSVFVNVMSVNKLDVLTLNETIVKSKGGYGLVMKSLMDLINKERKNDVEAGVSERDGKLC